MTVLYVPAYCIIIYNFLAKIFIFKMDNDYYIGFSCTAYKMHKYNNIEKNIKIRWLDFDNINFPGVNSLKS